MQQSNKTKWRVQINSRARRMEFNRNHCGSERNETWKGKEKIIKKENLPKIRQRFVLISQRLDLKNFFSFQGVVN